MLFTHLRRHCCNAGIEVDDAAAAFDIAWQNGAELVNFPTEVVDEATGTSQKTAEVKLYGDVTLRFVSGTFKVCLCPRRTTSAQHWQEH